MYRQYSCLLTDNSRRQDSATFTNILGLYHAKPNQYCCPHWCKSQNKFNFASIWQSNSFNLISFLQFSLFFCLHSFIKDFNLSIKAPVCQWVCLFVPYLLRNGEPHGAEILRDDSPWDWEGFRLKNILIRRTISWKIACILAPHSTLAVNLFSPVWILNVFARLVGGGEINK